VRDLAVLFLHVLATVARLAGPGGARSVIAESVLVKHQLLILNRSRKRSPNLRLSDRVVAGVCALLMRPRRLIRCAIVLPTKPGPKGPTQEIIAAIVDMKRRNPTWGCPGSRNRSPWPSRFPSPRMWCGAFSPFGTDLRQTQRGRPGSRSSGMRRTVCGVSTCFDANRPSCARTGCSS